MTTRRTTGTQTGPRSTAVVAAVRAAALQQLTELGYAEMTMGGVAHAAEVSRTTLYRRWPTKAALVASIAEEHLVAYNEIATTGDARADLLALMRTLRDNAERPESRAMFAAASDRSPDLDALFGQMLGRITSAFARVMRSGSDTVEEPRVDAAVHLLVHGVLTWRGSHGEAASDDDLATMADLVLVRL